MEIVPVTAASQRKKFIDFPHDLYANDPNYVPEIYIGQKELLSPKKNPFFKHSKVQCFLAYKNNKIVGRIAAIYNRNYCLLYTSPSPRDKRQSRMPSSA